MKFGLLGAGWFGRTAHLANLQAMPEAIPYAASSRSEASLAAARELSGPELRTSTNWKDVLEMDEIEAVIIALTNDLHFEACLAAFEAGKHVLCEKPLGLTIDQCDQMIAASIAAGKTLQVGHEMRFQRLYQKMQAMIVAKSIGDLQLMWCREYRGPMRPGWRSSEALTGGMILEKNSHHFDLFNWMIDTSPVRVLATGGRNVLKDREVLDNAQVIVEYENDRRATLEVCLFAPYGGECEVGAIGDLGRIDTRNQDLFLSHQRFDLPDRTEMQIADSETDANFVDGSGRIDRGIRPELEHFVQCCRTGKAPLTDGPSAKMSVALCLAAQESIKRIEAVEVAELLSH
ncbi:MAG: Gfo/Idh/MocA family oxidoreductase [Verrucomicrobiota bacterium]